MGYQTLQDGKVVVQEDGRITAGTADYETLLMDDNDLVNKKYVDGGLSALTSPLLFKGDIDVAADFPTASEVNNGWFYTITTDVTDDDASKTDTDQEFTAGDEIAWNGTDWTIIGNENEDLWDRTGTTLTPQNSGDNIALAEGKYVYFKGTSSTENIAAFGDQLQLDATDEVAMLASMRTKGIHRTISTKTANYTMTDDDHIILVDATSGNITISLPTTVLAPNNQFTIKKIDSSTNTVTIDANGTETIDSAATYVIGTQYDSITIVTVGGISTEWYII